MTHERASISPTRLLALLFALVLSAGCGDGNGGGQSDPVEDQTAQPPYINYHENDFAAHPHWRATANDLVLVDLEDPAADARDLDTGDAPGVDVIPIKYGDTIERTYCWNGDPEQAGNERVPHSMALLDDRGKEVLYLEEDQPCVTQAIAAGDYTMVFTHGDGDGEERDILFILPGDRAPSDQLPPETAQPAAAIAPGAGVAAPVPMCSLRDPFQGDSAPRSGEAWVGRSVIDRGMDVPGRVWILNGPCSDVRLIKNGIEDDFPDGTEYFVALMPLDTFVRVYQDPFFRGPRLLVKVIGADYPSIVHFVLPPQPFEFPVLGYIGSMIPEVGLPPYNRDTLISTRRCDHCNLQNVNLRGIDLKGVSLLQANLSHADLGGTMLNGVHANGALFQSANMVGVDLSGAELTGANFASAGPIPSMRNQDYPAADLSCATLVGATVSQGVLADVTLTYADLTNAHLDGADLTHAKLDGEKPTTCTKQKTNFTDAFMDYATLTSVSGVGVDLTRAKMSHANLQGAILTNARMEGAVLHQAVLGRDPDHHLEACQLTGTYLANADLSSADATRVNLENARFYGRTAKADHAVLTDANFGGAELSGTDFSNAQLQNATFSRATCIACKFNNAKMAGTSSTSMGGATFIGTRLEGADLSQATVDGCNFTNSIVSFAGGSYAVDRAGEFSYQVVYTATQMGEVTRSSAVICPDGGQGPCSPTPRLLPLGGTATPKPTTTPLPPTELPDPFATATPTRH